MEHIAPWYRPEDYPRIVEIMDDGAKMPKSFEEWKKAADRQNAEIESKGIVTTTVILDPEKFLAFCKERQLSRGSCERSEFVVWLATNEDQGTMPGGAQATNLKPTPQRYK